MDHKVSQNERLTFSPTIGRLSSLISSTEIGTVANRSRTEIDSHANIIVVGRHFTVFDSLGITCTVNAFFGISRET